MARRGARGPGPAARGAQGTRGAAAAGAALAAWLLPAGVPQRGRCLLPPAGPGRPAARPPPGRRACLAPGRRGPRAAPGRRGRARRSRAARRAFASAVCGEALRQFLANPLGYLTIPVVAALVGYGTNWVGVKMIFYPIGFWGLPVRRWPEQPLGLIGWQGIVPCKVKKMSARLVDIVTVKLLSLKEAFARLDPVQCADLLEPTVARAIEKDASWGEAWIAALRPSLRTVLIDVVKKMQKDIDQLIDLRTVVSSAFLRDKILLGELFQKAGRKELKFLVDSGFSFGFLLGILQMALWIIAPNSWTLPLGGALVGYITNWVAIKLIFDPVEPTPVGPFVMQGLFEKRQPEVSGEFSEFLAERVLTSPRLIDEIANGKLKHNFEALVRSSVPQFIPADITDAATAAFRKLALEPGTHPLHEYVDKTLGLERTLNVRLKALSAAEFEDLLHPVFQEDEIILVVAGGVLGALAGALQMAFGWGGPPAAAAAAAGAAGAGASRALLLLPPPWALSRLRAAAAGGAAAAAGAGSRLARLLRRARPRLRGLRRQPR